MKPEMVLIWHQIRRLKTFSCIDLAEIVGCDKSIVTAYVRDWVREGYLFCSFDAPNGSNYRSVYGLNSDCILPPTKTKPSGRDKIWISMRIMPRFTIVDLCATAEVTETNAQKFLAALIRVGVVRIFKGNRSGSKGSFHTYSLAKNLGKGTPIPIKDGRMLDSNTGKYLEVKL